VGVLLGAGAKVLGNIEIGACAKIAAGSVVLDPCRPVARRQESPHASSAVSTCRNRPLDMDHRI
jgi:serine O-acetyltransferase